MCGFRRPKNLRDYLVRANTPFREGDEVVRSEFEVNRPPVDKEQERASSRDLQGSVTLKDL